jgi:hypothetical protein
VAEVAVWRAVQRDDARADLPSPARRRTR